MNPIDFLKEVEVNYKVEDVKVNGLNIWQILRWHYANAYENMNLNDNPVRVDNSLQRKKYTRVLTKMSNSIWNLQGYLKKTPYVIFTDTLEERVIEGKISDKIAHGFLKEFSKDTLVCLNCIDKRHKGNAEYWHKNYISTDIFDIMKATKKVEVIIDNEEILCEIEREYGLKVNYLSILNNFFRYVDVFDEFLKGKQYKAIIVNCYYNLTHQALIFSAHKQGIKVIEFQHGIINSNHYAYNIFKPIGKDVFSDYIFVFGDYVKDIISENYIEKENIHSIGNFYIEEVIKESKKDSEVREYFETLRNKYSKIVVVTSQITIEDKLIDFIKDAAKKDDNILYLFIPRYFDKDFSKYNFPNNVVVQEKIDFYHSVGYCDFHATVYSTCAIEALSFGTPNILINIDGHSETNFSELLTEVEYTKYVNNPDEMINIIGENNETDRMSIIDVSQKFYKKGNVENIREAMKYINLL